MYILKLESYIEEWYTGPFKTKQEAAHYGYHEWELGKIENWEVIRVRKPKKIKRNRLDKSRR